MDSTLCLHVKVSVFIHVVFLKVGEIDTVKETYTADVFVQSRWREPLFDGQTNLVSRTFIIIIISYQIVKTTAMSMRETQQGCLTICKSKKKRKAKA